MDRTGRGFARLAALLLAFVLCGCNAFEPLGDDGSREARLEAARIAMDEGDYPSAVGLLEPLEADYPGDGEIVRALAAAYSGRAGLDLPALASAAAAAADNASLSTVGELLGTLPNPVDNGHLADIEASYARWTAVASGPNDYHSLALVELRRALLVILRDTDRDGDGVPDDFGTVSEPTIPDADAALIYASVEDALQNLTDPGRAALSPESDVLRALSGIRDGMDAVSPGEGASPADVRAYLEAELGGAA